MQSSHHDSFFDGETLRTADFFLTYAQNSTSTHHEIGAIHTNAAGKISRFQALIVDPIRRVEFLSTLGHAIQEGFRERCNEAFALRRQRALEGTETPKADVPVQAIRATGFWMETGKGRVFVLAHWKGLREDGTSFEGGWIPKHATFTVAA